MREALRGLFEWVNSTSVDLSGKIGNGGKGIEKPSPLPYHRISPGGNGGKDDAGRLTTLTTQEGAVVSEKSPKSRDLTTLTTLTTENDDRGRCASVTGDVAAALAWLSPGAHTAFIASPDGTLEVRRREPDGQWSPPLIERFDPRRAAKGKPSSCRADPEPPSDWGLSRYTIRDLARWYEEEANRRRDGDIVLDQRVLDRDLRRKLLAERGVFPEFIRIEFERVMRVVFAPIGSGSG